MKQYYGTYEIAAICKVAPPTVGRWIKEGRLSCFRTGGGHQRVWAKDLKEFLCAHNIPLPKELSEVRTLKVVIVDDESPVRLVLRRVFSKAEPPVELHEAQDGFAAGMLIHRLMPDLVVLDIRMSAVDGIEVCRVLRQDPAFKATRILIISGYLSDELALQARQAGADALLSKPFELEAFSKVVESLIPVRLGETRGDGDV
ncbi:MAG: response regulator [Elusimicrobiota bacterium]|jgi:excisionase family DNA binding protein